MLKQSAFASLCLLGIVNYCAAQSTPAAPTAALKTPAEAFAVAARRSDIRAEGSPPFRLKATFTAADKKGLVTTGEYSEVWISKNRWRRDFASGSHTEATACVSDTYYSTASDQALSGNIDDFIENLTPSVPKVKDTAETNQTWTLEPQTVNAVPLIRVAHLMTFSDVGKVPESAYYFTPDRGYLLGIASLSQSIIYGKLHAVFGKIVPYAIMIKYPGSKRTLEINITSFAPTENPPDDSLILPGSAKGKCSDGRQWFDGKVIAGNVISKVQPIYPEEARRKRQEGTVVLRITIGRNGDVRNIHIVSAPRADLAGSAIAAISGYKYKPFLLDNVPVEVDGTITVNYVSQ